MQPDISQKLMGLLFYFKNSYRMNSHSSHVFSSLLPLQYNYPVIAPCGQSGRWSCSNCYPHLGNNYCLYETTSHLPYRALYFTTAIIRCTQWQAAWGSLTVDNWNDVLLASYALLSNWPLLWRIKVHQCFRTTSSSYWTFPFIRPWINPFRLFSSNDPFFPA